MKTNSIKRLRCEHGNESMQTVLIMATGALVLIGFNGLFRQVSPQIASYIRAVVAGESPNQDREIGGGYPSSNNPSTPSRQDPSRQDSSHQNPSQQDIASPDDWFSAAAQSQMPKELADASNAIRNAIAEELREHVHVTLPTEAAHLEGLIDELIKVRDNLDPLSSNRRAIEEEISAIRRLSNKDLQNMMEGIEGRLAINESLSPILNSLGAMFNLDSMLEQDRTNHALGQNPKTTSLEAYTAYVDTFRISSGMLADGVINAATRGGKNPSQASQIANNAGVQVGIGLAADRAGVAIAESAFPAFNSAAYWLYDNGYSPRPPRFPRDWTPPKVYD